MRNKRRIAAILAMVMVATSMFTGPMEVRAGELLTDEIVYDENTAEDSDAPVLDEIQSETDDNTLVGTEEESLNNDSDVLTMDVAGDTLTAAAEDEDAAEVEPAADKFIEEEEGMRLDANGGVFPNGSSTIDLSSPTSYLNVEEYIPTRQGYKFIGWFEEPEQGNLISYSNYNYNIDYRKLGFDSWSEFRVEFAGSTVYAGWTQTFYTITYDFGSGYYEEYDENSNIQKLKKKSYQVLSGNSLQNDECYPYDSGVRNDDLHYSLYGYSRTEGGDEVIDRKTYNVSGNATLYAVWKNDKHVVTFNANGGYFKTYDEDNNYQEVSENRMAYKPSYDGNCYIYCDTPSNSDAKMAFAGWYLDAACTRQPDWVDGNENYLKLTNDITLYAKWNSTNKVLKLNPKGGYFYDYETRSKDYKTKDIGRDEGVNERFWIENPRNDDLHKSFTGWYSDSECKNILFKPEDGDNETLLSYNFIKDDTYYAGWEDKYHVATFDAGEGSFEYYDGDKYLKGSTAKYRIEENGRIYDTPYDIKYIDDSAVFTGWYIGDEKVYPTGNVYTSDVTFTAHYASYYKVTLNACGGYFEDDDEKQVTSLSFRVPQGQRAGNSPDGYWDEPEYPDGKYFDGWYLDSSYTKPIGYLYEFIPTSDVTLYAKWRNLYTISFNAILEPDEIYSTQNIYVPEGYKISSRRSSLPYFGNPDDKELAGWYKDRGLTQKIESWEILNTTVTTNMTFYARFIDTYEVTLYASGGFASGWIDNPYTIYVAQGESIKGKIPTVKSTGNKVFKAWFEDEGTSANEIKNIYDYPISCNKVLYAGYTEDNYTITFKANKAGAEFSDQKDTVSVNVVKGEAYRYASDSSYGYAYSCEAPGLAVSPEEYIFDGSWSLNADGTGNKYYFNGSTLYYLNGSGERTVVSGKYGFVPTGNMTFYACWADTVKVTLSANGGKFEVYQSNSVKQVDEYETRIKKGSTINSINYPRLYRNGYEFKGWYLDAACTNPADNTAIDHAMTVYAGWTTAGGGSGGGDSEYDFSLTLHGGEGFFDGERYLKVKKHKYTTFTAGTWYYPDIPQTDDDSRIFLTWCFDEACKQPVDEADIIRLDSSNIRVRFNSKVTDLYAKYGSAYTVRLNANGGYFDTSFSRRMNPNEDIRNSTVLITKTLSGSAINVSNYTERIRRDGDEIFGGWYTDKACTKKAVTYVDHSSGEYYTPKGNETLYAKWIDYAKPDRVTISGNRTLKVGDTVRLTAAVTPDSVKNSQDIHWWISGTQMTTNAFYIYKKYPIVLEADGTITAQAPGKATLYVDVNGVRSEMITVTVTEEGVKTTLEVKPEKLSMVFGETANLAASVLPVSKASSLIWKSSDESIVKVNGKGLDATVTAQNKAGKATVTVTCDNVSAKVEINVAAAPGVRFDKHEIILESKIGSTAKITATVTGSGYSVDTLKWTSSNPKAATVSGGTVTAVAGLESLGETTIKAETPDGKYYDTCTVKVKPPKMLNAPAANVASGQVARNTRVRLTADIAGADIYYTEDGSNPTTSSKRFNDAIVLSTDKTIKTIAAMSGYKTSPVATYTYTIKQDWGDLGPAEQAIFNYNLDKVPESIWYLFNGVNTYYTKTTATSANKIYNGDKLIFGSDLKVFYGTRRLEENRDYKVTYKNNVKVAKATDSKAPTVTVKGKGNYDGSAVFTFSILAADIRDGRIDSARNIALTEGKAIGEVDPEISYVIKNKEELLKKGTDYELKYYKAGVEIKPADKVVAGSEYIIKITGTGSFTGSLPDIKVTGVDSKAIRMNEVSVTIPEVPYDGKGVNVGELFKTKATVKSGSTTLVYGTDYTVDEISKSDYPLYPSAGDYAVTLHGKTNSERSCVGDRVAILTIKGTEASQVKVACLNTKPEYTGGTITRADLYKDDGSGFDKVTLYTVAGGKKVALAESDYEADYSQIGATGKSKLTFTLKNGYTGKITKNITVKQYNISTDSRKVMSITCEDAIFSKAGATPAVTVKYGNRLLKEGVDYKVKYSSNKKVTTNDKLAVVKVTGLGNYKGTAKRNFNILKADSSRLTLYAKDKKYSDKNNNFKTTIAVRDNGKTVAKSQAGYDKKTVKYFYADTQKEITEGTKVAPGTVVEARLNVTCSETSPYYGTTELVTRFRIVDKSKWITGSSVTIKTDNLVFDDGNEIIPLKKDDVVVKVGGTVLTADQYDIVSITGNKFVGTAKVEIVGRAPYGGLAKKSFKIKRRSLTAK